VADAPFASEDVLLVGLGNPGEQYRSTRHNAGFLVLDELYRKRCARGGGRSPALPSWKSKFEGSLAVLQDRDRKIVLLKPETYMNLSGNSVQPASRFYRIPPERICVVHDDMDFDLGVCRFRQGGGDGGHNGLKSVTERLSTREYLRLRFGIGRPKIPEKADIRGNFVHSWVLGAFSGDEEPVLKGALEGAVRSLDHLLRDGFERAQNRTNTRKR
jgi:PTH1 family peptidyl-tRNA hydrolase